MGYTFLAKFGLLLATANLGATYIIVNLIVFACVFKMGNVVAILSRGFQQNFNLFSGGVKKNPQTSTANKKDVETALAKWFSGARDRDGRRALRVKNVQHVGRSPAADELSGDDTDNDVENDD